MYRDVAIRAARAGGHILRQHFDFGTEVLTRDLDNVVTAADRASEIAILSQIRDALPAHAIFSEEEGASLTDSEYLWVIDPLDGTHNFVLGLPYFSISIALLHLGRPILGVVYHPILDDLYVAERGKGATLNGETLCVADLSELRQATAYYDQGYAVGREAGLQLYTPIARATRRCLQMWAPALDWCSVARGRGHLIITNAAEMEDKLAGMLILQEAGGVVTDWAGRSPRPVTIDTPDNNMVQNRTISLVGSVPGIHQAALQLIQSALEVTQD
ncbi:MAG: inositol monophosphatase [Chloroflexi bacterium]|nr:MAG: inositol monophosphatase [Chloroflexota bacterium]